MDNKNGLRLVEKKNIQYYLRLWGHRMGNVGKALLALVLIALMIYLLFFFYKNQTYAGFVVSTSVAKENLPNNTYINNNGNIVSYSKDGISAMDAAGKVLWNRTYEMQKPIVHCTTSYVAVCDYDGHLIDVIDASGNVTQVDTNLPIRDFSVSPEGRIAAILEDGNTSWINIYKADGSRVVEIKATISKTGYPLAVALSGEVMGVTYFGIHQDKMKSSVTFYNFGGVGENSSDHIVSSYDYVDAVVPLIGFLDSETVFAVADNRLMFYKGNVKPTSTSDTLISDNIVAAYYGVGNVALIFNDVTGQGKYSISLYDTSGKKLFDYIFDMDYKDVIISNNQVMIYNEVNCILLGTDGKEKFKGQLPDKVIMLGNTNSNKKYIAITKDQIETMVFE